MTILDAFVEWGREPQFIKLANMYRQAFNKVFLDNYGDIDVKIIGADTVRNILDKSDQPKEVKVRSVSALEQVLTYASCKGYCNKPDFNYTIASEVATKPAADEVKVTVKPAALAARKVVIEKKKAKNHKKVAPKDRKISAPREVCQLDPVTLKMIKKYANASEGGRAVGSKNVLRAIQKHTLCGGYYWAFPDGVGDFKPSYLSNPVSLRNTSKTPRLTQRQLQQKRIDEENAMASMEEQLESLEEARQALEQEIDARESYLAQFSNDELLYEMRRRKWQGNITIPQIIEL